VDDQRLGAVVRAVRLRRRLRQRDVADAAGVSHGTVSLIERGHCERLSIATIRRIAATIDVLNRRHSMRAESVATCLAGIGGWTVEPEVSFAIYGERGVVDQIGWHAGAAHLLLLELKTQLVDVNEVLGTLDRKRRLARQIASTRGWTPDRISVWLVVTDTCTNRRHAREHATLLRSRYPLDGRQLRRILRNPADSGCGVAFWAEANRGSTRPRSEPSARAGRHEGMPRTARAEREFGARQATGQLGAPVDPGIRCRCYPDLKMTRSEATTRPGACPGHRRVEFGRG